MASRGAQEAPAGLPETQNIMKNAIPSTKFSFSAESDQERPKRPNERSKSRPGRPRRAQKRSREAQEKPKNAPGRPKSGVTSRPGRPNSRQEPGRVQEGARRGTGAKRLPGAPKVPREPKTAKNRQNSVPQPTQIDSKIIPKSLSEGFGPPPGAPSGPQEHQRSAQERSRSLPGASEAILGGAFEEKPRGPRITIKILVYSEFV